jgi:RecB family exonuclease
MRRHVTSLAMHDRLSAAAEFIAGFAGEEILLLAPTRTAADELVRQYCIQRNGAFGIHRFTLPQFAYILTAERLAEDGRSFLTGVAMDALAARAVQNCKLTWFEPVANTPGFFRALASTINELRLNDIAPAAIQNVDLAKLLAEFDRNLQEGEAADLAAAYKTAIDVIRGPQFRYRGRPLLILDIVPVSRLEQQILDALSDAASDVFLGNWGQGGLSPVSSISALDRLRRNIFEPATQEGEMDGSVEFLSATDESRECAEIARSALELARSGTPFDRMAIALRNPGAYQPLVEDALRRADIPGFYTLGSRRPNSGGRAFLALLACASERLSASRFSEYLSLGETPKIPAPPPAGPVQGELFADEESPATPYQWEKLLVDAAVIGGRARWVRRLDGLTSEYRKRISEVQAEEDSRRQHLDRQLQRLDNLRRFALPLIESLDRLPVSATWGVWIDALEALATEAIRYPEAVLSVLGELRPMSGLGPVSLDEVREVLAHRLAFLRTESPDRRYGRIFVATTAELAGLSFDVVFLPGLAEDIFPKKAFEDPLLLDDARRAISPQLDTQPVRIARERLLLHIAAGAARSRLWVSWPRMDLAQGRPRSPSFYALDVLRAITGRTPDLGELQRLSTTTTQPLIGWPAPRDSVTAIDDAEYDLAVISGLLRLRPEEARGRARYLVNANASLARSLRARSGRWKPKWLEGDGIIPAPPVLEALSPHRLTGPTARSYSATALQQFGACPYRFLLYAIHRLQPRQEAAAIERLDALTRGSLFHAAQFRLLTELRSIGLLPVHAENLAPVLTVTDRVFDEVAEEYREELAPAIPRIWESQIEDIRWDLRGWIRQMAEPANAGWVPSWFELSFGLPASREKDPASSPTPIVLAQGLHLRGAIDMVEERDGAIRITDHKTGKAPLQRPGLTGHGEILQPILYAEAAETLLNRPAVSARLSYCTERGGYQIFEIPVEESSRASLSKVLSAIDGSIMMGFLPAAPRKDACVYCDYRVVCGPYEETRIRRKPAEQLAGLTGLRETP